MLFHHLYFHLWVMSKTTPPLRYFAAVRITAGWYFLPCLCSGVDAAPLFNLAESYLGGKSLTSGPEHPAASDRRIRHLLLLAGARHRTRCQLWFAHLQNLHIKTYIRIRLKFKILVLDLVTLSSHSAGLDDWTP